MYKPTTYIQKYTKIQEINISDIKKNNKKIIKQKHDMLNFAFLSPLEYSSKFHLGIYAVNL